MLRFQTQIQAHPPGTTRGTPLVIAGCEVRPVLLPQPQVRPTWGVTFDLAAERLQALPRFYYEPDGSFAWFAAAGEAPWRLEGNLFDRGDELAYVDLKGTCPEADFDAILTALRWPQSSLLFQLPQVGVYLDEPDFRRFASFTSP